MRKLYESPLYIDEKKEAIQWKKININVLVIFVWTWLF